MAAPLLGMLSSASGLVSTIGTGISSLGKIIGDLVSELFSLINQYVIQPLKDFGDWIWGGITAAWDWTVSTLGALMGLIGDFFSFVYDNVLVPIGDMFVTGYDWTVTAIGAIIGFIGDIWDFIMTYVIDPGISLFTAGWNAAKTLVGWVVDSAVFLWDLVNGIIIQPMISLFGLGYNALVGMVQWVIGAVSDIWNFISTVFITPAFNFASTVWNGIITTKNWIFDTVKGIWNYLDSTFITPVVDFGSRMWDNILSGKEWFFGAVRDVMNFVDTYFLTPIGNGLDYLGGVIDVIVDSIEWALDAGSNLWDTATGWIPGFSEGGIATGPSSGYPAMLHGTEAIVPLSGGRSIPVEINGPTGGGGNTFNITVNAGGITDRTDKRQLAREIGNMIQQEMSRSIGGTTMQGRY